MKSSRPIRILHIIERIEKNNGVTAVVLNYFRNMDRSKVIFDFVVHKDSEQDLENEIIQLGGKIYYFPELSFSNIKKCKEQMETLLATKRYYSVIHCHLPNMAFVYLKAAKEKQVPIRIIHSHNSKGSDKLAKRIRNYFLHWAGVRYANHYMACSWKAARYLYGRNSAKAFLLNNAIDLTKYRFDEGKRKQNRLEMQLDDFIVLGHVGRFCKQKNHAFLLEVLEQLVKENNKYRLLLVGNGELEREIKEKCRLKGLNSFVVFAGLQQDVPKYLSVMDLFLLPSLFEGLPLVGIEAQAMGLTCFVSSEVTRETKISDRIFFLGLDAPKWADKINHWIHEEKQRDKQKRETSSLRGYDIAQESLRLLKYYEQKYWQGTGNDEKRKI